jgi:hypothetical protein
LTKNSPRSKLISGPEKFARATGKAKLPVAVCKGLKGQSREVEVCGDPKDTKRELSKYQKLSKGFSGPFFFGC